MQPRTFDNWQIAYYNADNYREEIINTDCNRCIIFFSSNGLNSESMLANDRYEWDNLAKMPSLKKSVGKYIFVRDVYLDWYINGINPNINNISKLKDFLQTKTIGYEIYTIGTSSGGYMATLLGSMLGAKMCINISGQYSLWKDNQEYMQGELQKYVDTSKSDFFDIVKYINNNRTPVFYFYPGHSKRDILQAEYIGNLVYCFKMDSENHGMPLKSTCAANLLTKSPEKLISLYDKHKNNYINPMILAFEIMGINYLISTFHITVLKVFRLFLSLIKSHDE